MLPRLAVTARLEKREIGQEDMTGSISAKRQAGLGPEIVEADHGPAIALALPSRREEKIEERKPAFHHHLDASNQAQLIGYGTATGSKATVTAAPRGRWPPRARAIAGPSCAQKYSQRVRREPASRSGPVTSTGGRRNPRSSRVSID